MWNWYTSCHFLVREIIFFFLFEKRNFFLLSLFIYVTFCVRGYFWTNLFLVWSERYDLRLKLESNSNKYEHASSFNLCFISFFCNYFFSTNVIKSRRNLLYHWDILFTQNWDSGIYYRHLRQTFISEWYDNKNKTALFTIRMLQLSNYKKYWRWPEILICTY